MNSLTLLLLLVGVYCCFGSRESSKNYWREDVDGDVHNDSDHDQIKRPCSLNDMHCMSQFLAQNSHCSVRHGPVPDPLYLDRNTVPLPIANVTIILNNIQVKGLDGGKITEFYINKKTNILVMAVEVRGLTIHSANTQIKYHRKGREPLVLQDSTVITYRKVTFTITIPKIKDLKLSNAEVYTFLDDNEPPYNIWPNLIPTKDPQAMKSYTKIVNNIPSSVSEAFVFHGPLFMAIYIQENLCDFGLKVQSY